MADQAVRVLLIEDDEDDYILTQALFAQLPLGWYRLERAGDYDSALTALDECRHDVYLVDYHLGAHTGLELVAEALARGCRSPLIMLTGQRQRDLDLRAMQAGAVDYLVKDRLDADTLERSMRYALRHKQQEAEIRQANLLLEQRVSERTEQLARANEAMATSQRFLRTVIDALPSHIAVLDQDGKLVLANAAWQRQAQASAPRPELPAVGQNFLAAWDRQVESGASLPRAADAVRAVLRGELPDFEVQYARGTPWDTRWHLLRVSPFPRPGPVLAVVAHDDITARVLSEQALRRQSQQLAQLALVATQLNLAHDVRDVLHLVTEAARSIIGAHQCLALQAADDDQRRPVQVVVLSEKYQALPAADQPLPLTNFDRIACRINQPWRLSSAELAEHPQFDPAEYAAALRPVPRGWLSAPLVGRDGRNLGLLQLSDKFEDAEFSAEDEAILVQLAQLASGSLENAFLYRGLKELDARKDRFLATLAHELRNPLSPLTTAAELLGLDPHNAEQVQELTLMMTRQLEHLRRLIDDLLDVSRISSGKLILRPETVSLHEAIAAALDVAQPRCQQQHQQLHVHLPPEPILVSGDKVRLAQVVGNLLINASKFTPAGGRIELELSTEQGSALVWVRDTGIGIPREMLGRIFGLFTQVDSSDTRAQGGLGIGLTLARTLVQLHGGSIWADSPGENQGSQFCVRLPLAEPPAAGNSATQSEPPATTPSWRILVVDDNRSASHLLGRMLQKLGQQVTVAHGVAEALEQIPRVRPQAIISDIAMPEQSGFDLARQVRELPLSPPPVLIAMTGYGQASDVQQTQAAGFRRHLIKPVALADLRKLLSWLAGQG